MKRPFERLPAIVSILFFIAASPAYPQSSPGLSRPVQGAVEAARQSRPLDIVSVRDFGALGNGTADDARAFAAAAATGRLILVPDGNYRLDSDIRTTAASWWISPGARFSGAGRFDWRRGVYGDVGGGTNIWRFADRVFVDAAANNSGNFESGSWITSDVRAGYIERASSLVSISSYGGIAGTFATRASDLYEGAPVWRSGETVAAGDRRGYQTRLYQAENSGKTLGPPPRHQSGTIADGGGVRWTWLRNTGRVTAPVATFLQNDIPDDGFAKYGLYAEVSRAPGASVTFAAEIDVKNLGNDVVVNPYTIFPAGATVGYWFAAGGGGAYGGVPANPSSAAIIIGSNEHTWNSGIIFERDGLTGSDGASGSAEAIALARGHEINWYQPGRARGARLRSDADAPGQGVGQLFANNGVEFSGLADGKRFFQARRVAAGANYIDAVSAVAGAGPTLSSQGDDANIDLNLGGKGTGGVVAAFTNDGLRLKDGDASHHLAIRPASNLTADRSLRIATGDGDRKLDISASDVTISPFGANLVAAGAAQGATASLRTWHVVAADAAAASHTGGTGEAALATVTIPAGAIGPNGQVRVTSLWSFTGSASAKTMRIRLGGESGTQYFNEQVSAEGQVQYQSMILIRNRNSASSQVGAHAAFSGLGASTGAVTRSSIDTTEAVALVFSGQLGNARETITLESYTVEVLHGGAHAAVAGRSSKSGPGR